LRCLSIEMTIVVARTSDQPARLDAVDREIVAAPYTPLRRYAGVVGSVDIDPDDLVQEAFLRVLRKGSLP
jgi:DNA-directed RNA polymerase specialized sigma24 family protein